mmetsp:Transcript_16256/g.28463  ORF Transcript_16256/g.28463 Transcript_16256/m.28463 type:complete len:111 (-) Transcript_16256:86-418(-)|eukprot:CAMPEP_0184696410 /NCGR_PEP_ID=MMETSP0313-20130426/3720_1 /TAXON_ID=2792 /ORGANISM="Porphyridium aerugineum, Strain SAG 1380-2" /LENGTH=110 /DNA_ID=CAMNT_0027155037 /DNA_START=133 /DNA_END=465 /DNA_ORIENTATION=+
MKYLAAYMLCTLGGVESPSADQVKKVLTAAGSEVDDAALNAVVSELHGKKVEEVLEAGKKKFSSVPMGGAGAAPAAAAAPAAGGKGAPAAKEEPKKEEEEEEESGFDLFG